MNNEVLTTKVTNGIAVITLGSEKRMYFDQAMGDALTESLERFARPEGSKSEKEYKDA